MNKHCLLFNNQCLFKDSAHLKIRVPHKKIVNVYIVGKNIFRQSLRPLRPLADGHRGRRGRYFLALQTIINYKECLCIQI